MQYKLLGKTGILVSELCFGTMTFGGGSGIWKDIGNIQQKIADDMLKISLGVGINFIDTANVYSNGRSEEITGQAIRNLGIPREDIVLATKVLGPMGKSPNARGASPCQLKAPDFLNRPSDQA